MTKQFPLVTQFLRRAQHAKPPEIHLPAQGDWRTTDEDEINRRKLRAREEAFETRPIDGSHPVFGAFAVRSGSGLTYSVEVRSVEPWTYACTCVDFRINGLGTCKHTEAVRLSLEARPEILHPAIQEGSPWADIVPEWETDSLRLERGYEKLPPRLRTLFDANGVLQRGIEVEHVLDELRKCGKPVRLSQDVDAWTERRQRDVQRVLLRREYEEKVRSGEYPPHETKVPLFPYQRDGMLHLAFTERALLADEMGLGKTIQAIAACALLHRLGMAKRVLVVTPASLKAEWEEQIARFTDLQARLVFGGRRARIVQYNNDPPFFTIVNYEQVLADTLDLNGVLGPDIVVLDEAQRIKNWAAKTAQAVKRLKSRYAFVLTGTPLENRIDEIRSIVDFLDPARLGPLFRFNRAYYEFDHRGRPSGYQNLDKLRELVRPVLLRRRKADVETELPSRTDQNLFVDLAPSQRGDYEAHERIVSKLITISKRRPLTKDEQDRLMRELNIMRILCDTPYILDRSDKTCPKLPELASVLDDCLREPDTKAIIFSEWERMLDLVREHLRAQGIGFAWHTGSVPQQKRRREIRLFREDPKCRAFLSTDSGGVGLNLQNASVVINCDLPWNPARLEQRIARAWRKNQTRPVTVVNLVARGTIENGMLGTLCAKRELAEGVLDGSANLEKIRFHSGAQTFLKRLEQVMAPRTAATTPAPSKPPPPPRDPALAIAAAAARLVNGKLVRCEEHFAAGGIGSVAVVVIDATAAEANELYHQLKDAQPALFHGPHAQDFSVRVLTRDAWDALQQFADAGLMQFTARGRRVLSANGTPEPSPLGDAETRQVGENRDAALRKLRVSRMFLAENFLEEARAALHEATLSCGKACAIANRLPEPLSLAALRQTPYNRIDGRLTSIGSALEDSAVDISALRRSADVLAAALDALSPLLPPSP